MEHPSAAKYYKINIAFLALFMGFTFYNFKKNETVFWNDKFGKVYLGLIATGVFSLYVFSNQQIQALYLLKGQKDIGILTYSNFGFSYNRLHTIPVSQIKGSRNFWSKSMNLFYLEYNVYGAITKNLKKKSYFYRPQVILNKDLWDEIKQGNEVLTMGDIKSADELDLLRKMKKRTKVMAKYK